MELSQQRQGADGESDEVATWVFLLASDARRWQQRTAASPQREAHWARAPGAPAGKPRQKAARGKLMAF